MAYTRVLLPFLDRHLAGGIRVHGQGLLGRFELEGSADLRYAGTWGPGRHADVPSATRLLRNWVRFCALARWMVNPLCERASPFVRVLANGRLPNGQAYVRGVL